MSDLATTDVVAASGGYRRLLRTRDFRRLWWSQFVSGIGDWLVVGLIIPLVSSLSNNSSFAVAGILIVKIIPALLFSSFIGAFVDRFDRRKIMIAADLGRAGMCFVLFAVTAPSNAHNALWQIYVVELIMETMSLFFVPAKNSLIPRLVHPDDVAAANGLSYTTSQASMLVGLVASGAIIALFERIVRFVIEAHLPVVSHGIGLFAPGLAGPRAGVILDSFTFFFSAWAIWRIHVNARPEGGGVFDLSLIGKDVRDSFSFLKGQRQLVSLLVTIGLAILGGGAIIPVGVTYVHEDLNPGHFLARFPLLEHLASSPQFKELAASPQIFMLVFLALGALAGALMAPKLQAALPLRYLFPGSVAIFGVSMLGFASVTNYNVAEIFAIGAGIGLAVVNVAGNTYVIYTTADSLRGRVFTAMESVIRIALLTSMLVFAPLADFLSRNLADGQKFGQLPTTYTTGTRLALQIASLIVIGAAFYGYFSLRWGEAEAAEKAAAAEEEAAEKEAEECG